jgi:hypothetical protein
VLSECGNASGERGREREGSRRKEKRIANVIWRNEGRIECGLIPAMEVFPKASNPKWEGERDRVEEERRGKEKCQLNAAMHPEERGRERERATDERNSE